MKMPLLAVGAGAGLILALALAPATGSALGALASARGERALLRMEIARPETRSAPLAAAGLVTGDAGALVARVRARAKQGGVLVEEAGDVSRGGALTIVRLRLSGPEKAVVALADSLERESPLVRWRSWRIDPLADGGIRLGGEAVAVRR